MRKGLSLSSLSSLSTPSLMSSSSSGEVKESRNVFQVTIVKKIVEFWFFLVSFVFVCATDLLMTKILLFPSRRSCHYRNLISHSKPNSKFKNWLEVNLFFCDCVAVWLEVGELRILSSRLKSKVQNIFLWNWFERRNFVWSIS